MVETDKVKFRDVSKLSDEERRSADIMDLIGCNMNYSERCAYEFLKRNNFDPVRIYYNIRTPENAGIPDFKCNRNRYIEIKTSRHFSLNINQINRFNELIDEGSKVYIMVLERRKGMWHFYTYGHIITYMKSTKAGKEIDIANKLYVE